MQLDYFTLLELEIYIKYLNTTVGLSEETLEEVLAAIDKMKAELVNELKQNNMKTPQFKNIQFDSFNELMDWLNHHTYKVVYLKDIGQDMQILYIHESGEILYTDYQSDIYCGKFVDVSKLTDNEYLHVWSEEKNDFVPYLGLKIENVR